MAPPLRGPWARALLLAAVLLAALAAPHVHAARTGRTLLRPGADSGSNNTVVVGLLGSSLEMTIASRAASPFFAQLNVVVRSITYTASVDLMNAVIAGEVDIVITSADNPIDRILNFAAPLSIVAGTLNAGPYAIATNTAVGGAASWDTFRGTKVAVDAVQSGFIYALFAIAAQYNLYPGLDNPSPNDGDYQLYPYGTTNRFTALKNGLVQATTLSNREWFGLQYCADKPCGAPYANVKVLGAITDVLPRYVSQVAFVNQPKLDEVGGTPKVTRFLAALILANRYFYDPANKADILPLLAGQVRSNFIDDNITTAYYDFLQTARFGDPVDLRLDEVGLQAALQLRADYQNIFITNSGSAAPEGLLGPIDAKHLSKSRKGGLVDLSIYHAALALANHVQGRSNGGSGDRR